MKKILIITILVFISNLAKTQPLSPIEKQWIPVDELTDEFNGSVLDGNKWINYHPYWVGRAPSVFKKENVSVSGGYLKLKSTVANYQQEGNWVNAACVSSKTKAMKPGYYSEARIKCPTLSMTGAYWFQGNYSEIDVIENFGAPTSPVFAGHETHMKTCLHYFKDGWNSDKATPWEAAIVKPACDKDFFTYGVWWKDSVNIAFYLDGKEVHISRAGGFFKENMYMFFDMETFLWGIGLPTIESLDDSTKNTQYVDWVRTYKLEYKPESVPVTAIILHPDTITLKTLGATHNITSEIVPSNATNQNVRWVSDNTAVATVTSEGIVKAISGGTAKITCTTQDAGKTATTVVIVDLSTGINSIKKIDNNKVKIYPNPVTGNSFNIKLNEDSNKTTVRISDLNGKVFFEQAFFEKEIAIDRNIFSSDGIFLINVFSSGFNCIHKITCIN